VYQLSGMIAAQCCNAVEIVMQAVPVGAGDSAEIAREFLVTRLNASVREQRLPEGLTQRAEDSFRR
jgi:hypothetical protein